MGMSLNFAEAQGDTNPLTSASADLVVQQQVFTGRLGPLKQLHQTKSVSQFTPSAVTKLPSTVKT